MTDRIRILEALLFASERPLTIAQIQELYPELEEKAIEEAFDELRRFYDDTERAFTLVTIAGGYQLLTRPDVAAEVERFLVGRRRQRLSRAALEVLAVVAYRQPVTRGEVESIRGVDCGGVFRTLLERQLIGIKGRAPSVGHPLLYATTERFLEHFGLMELSELPKLEEFEALVSREEAREELERAGMIPPVPASEADESDSDVTETEGAEAGAEATVIEETVGTDEDEETDEDEDTDETDKVVELEASEETAEVGEPGVPEEVEEPEGAGDAEDAQDAGDAQDAENAGDAEDAQDAENTSVPAETADDEVRQ